MASNSGVLYVVATPIGNLADISQRAIEVLSMVDFVAAEDTRHAQKLLNHMGLRKQLIAYHEHNESKQLNSIVKRLTDGSNLALISDAGTPLISDPGYPLVSELHKLGITVVPVPGPSAVISALSISGLPTDRFIFEGFLPAKSNARKQAMTALANEKRTVIWYESCHRIEACLNDMCEVFGDDRLVSVCRELTKRFETIKQASLVDLCQWIKEPNQQKGEFVLVVDGNKSIENDIGPELQQQLQILLDYLAPSQAAAALAQMSGHKKKPLYQLALTLKND